ncbi:MAG: PilZ domain-containing protein [Sandaracinaceae bacterium]
MGIERRRTPRVRASLEVQVGGVENRATLRHGDLSLTGLFVDANLAVDPGAVHALKIRTRDKEMRVEVPGRVVRVLKSDDLLEGTVVSGVAFEFLFYEAGKREEIAAMLLHVTRGELGSGEVETGHALTARLSKEDGSSEDARVDAVSLGGLSIETDWQLRKGETIRVELPTPEGGSVKVEGCAVRSRRSKSGTFRTRIELSSQTLPEGVDRSVHGVHDALTKVVEAAVAPTSEITPTRKEHLSGDLAMLGVPSLLSLAGLEQMTGVLRVGGAEGDGIEVFLQDGRVVDAMDGSGAAPRAVLAELCRRGQGSFALTLEPVDRPDRLGASTTALLLDLAREEDEATRVVA